MRSSCHPLMSWGMTLSRMSCALTLSLINNPGWTQDLNFYDVFVNILVRFKLRSRGVAVNMPACHAGDRGFKSHRLRQYISGSSSVVEHRLPKPGVAGSNPVSRSRNSGTFGSTRVPFFSPSTATNAVAGWRWPEQQALAGHAYKVAG